MGSTTRRFRLALAAVAVGLGAFAGGTAPVFADAPGPSDYRSEIRSVEPPTSSIEVGIIGGDSFVELRVDSGTEATVIGYQGEDYLWFRPDGVVLENQNSPATYLNARRYGTTDVPASADPAAEPLWKQIGTGGYWAWHDHRAHWMQNARPFGVSVGDQILEAVIPLVVDGDKVEVTVISTWQPEPSPLPMWFGTAAGLGVTIAMWLLRRGRIPPVVATLPAASLALVVGAVQYLSLPSVTGPRPIWFVLPAIAVLSAVAGVVLARRGRRFGADAATLLVGVELAVWGFVKRDGLGAAIVPTSAPQWLDRFTTAFALIGGAAIAAVALWWLFAVTVPVSDSREPSGSPRPARP